MTSKKQNKTEKPLHSVLFNIFIPVLILKNGNKWLDKYFGDTKMSEAIKPVVILSYDIETRSPVLLKSYSETDKDITLVDAGDATSAAPIYYPTAKVGDRYLIDGAIVANHPVLHGYVEAKKIFPECELKVLSIGSGLKS